MDLVSIILPVYNIEPKIFEKCLESIMNQTYSNLEINIIFDKSNNKRFDDQVELILQQRTKDKRIIIIKRNTNGFVSALNEGIICSNGKYIARMDADDISEITRIEKQVKFLLENHLDIIGSWAYVIKYDSIIGKLEPPDKHVEIRKRILLHNPILHSSLFLKKSIFEKIGNYDPKYAGAEDYELYIRAIWKGFKIGNIPEYLVHIRETPTSIVRNLKSWKKTRKAYIRVKINSVLHYRFRSLFDLIYCIITPISYFISPNHSLLIKRKIGWFKET